MQRLMSKSFYFVLFLGSNIAFASPGYTPAQQIAPALQTPTQAIQSMDKQADQYRVGKNLSPADIAFNRQLKQQILHGTFDLRELAKQSLDKYWNQRTPKEQDQFVELLSNLLEERSILSKEKATEKGPAKSYHIQYVGDVYQNRDKTDVRTKTVIRLPKRNMKISLDYKLKKTATGWRIYDVIMDGASLIENYRYSFSNIISKQGYSELVRRMQNKLNEFRGKA